MTKKDKTRDLIARGESDASIRFDELCLFLRECGFAERVRGSHHIFRKEGIPKLLNLSAMDTTQSLTK